MEYYNTTRVRSLVGDESQTNNYQQSNSNNNSHSSLFHNNQNSTIHDVTTNQATEDLYRQVPSLPSGDGDIFQIPSTSVDSTGSFTEDGILKCADDDVDSALLAALRDPRERVSLLRTEQALIDFMNQPDGYMEIGGPYNSIILSPTGSVTATATNSNKSLNNEYFGGRVMQTSFQRCWLHRLADRFNITRENGCLMDGSIRLVKIRESTIPRKLLVDLDESEYAQPATTNMEDSLSSLGGVTQQFSSVGFSGNNAAASPLISPPPTTATATTAPPKTKQPKMKIMKRHSSSSFGSTGSLNTKNNNGKGSAAAASRKGKNFSDKEKAYAEARARIFNESSSATSAGNGESSLDAIATATSITEAAVISRCNPPATTSSSAAASPITSKSPSVASSGATSPATTPPPSVVVADLKQAIEDDESPKAATATITEAKQPQSQYQQQVIAPRRPAAASTGGGSKATYRNRRQEESDPDFQRGFASVPMMTPAYDTAYMYGYQAQQQYYVYPDEAASTAYYGASATSAASGTSMPSGTPILISNHSEGQAPYVSYSQGATYVNNDGSLGLPTTGARTTTGAVGVDDRGGRNNLNGASLSSTIQGYYNPYAYSAASTAVSSSRLTTAVTATSTGQEVPPYEEFPALR